jgi:hypothetical protein
MIMRTRVSTVVLLFSLAPVSLHSADRTPNARIWAGYLVDVTCATDRKKDLSTLGPEHTKKCLQMPACQNSGYALLTDRQEVFKLDSRGNDLAKKFMQRNSRVKGWKVEVEGALDGDHLNVKRLKPHWQAR